MEEKKRRRKYGWKKKGKNKIKNKKLKLRNAITIFLQYFHNTLTINLSGRLLLANICEKKKLEREKLI